MVDGKWRLDPDATGTASNGDTFTGVKVNTNLRCAGGNGFCHDLDGDLAPGGGNVGVNDSGVYDITVDWTPAGGIQVSMVKLSDLEFERLVSHHPWCNWNWSYGRWDSAQLGLIRFTTHFPSVDGTTYTYVFTGVEVTADNMPEGFKLREDNRLD